MAVHIELGDIQAEVIRKDIKHLHLSVRPEAAVRILLTGHMDTVFPADHPFQRSH